MDDSQDVCTSMLGLPLCIYMYFDPYLYYLYTLKYLANYSAYVDAPSVNGMDILIVKLPET